MITCYVLEYDSGNGRSYWPEALQREVAIWAARRMRRDGLKPKVLRINICDRILSSGIEQTWHRDKHNTG